MKGDTEGNKVYDLLKVITILITFIVGAVIYINNVKNKADNNEKMIDELKKVTIPPIKDSALANERKISIIENEISHIKENPTKGRSRPIELRNETQQ